MTFKIVVCQPIHDAARNALESHGTVVMNPGPQPFSEAALAAECQDAHALMAFMTERISEDLVARCGQLKIVAGALKGYNNIDVAACSRRGIVVTIVPDLLTEPTAELTIGLMIAVARQVIPGDAHMRSGNFTGWSPRFYGGSLAGATVAMIGAGAVGRAVMRLLRGFDCTCLYVDTKALAPDVEASLSCARSDLDGALEQADFVVLGLHLMPETQHLVDRAFLTKMKPGSYLINPARGSLVDEAAVADALEAGHLAGYAADTFEMEDWTRPDRPRNVPGRLTSSERTVLTPHIGSAVLRVRQAIELSAAQSIAAAARGEMPQHAVNAEAIAVS